LGVSTRKNHIMWLRLIGEMAWTPLILTLF
jgi:hypothetical protein